MGESPEKVSLGTKTLEDTSKTSILYTSSVHKTLKK